MITSSIIKKLALEIGFDLVGITQAEPLSEDIALMKDWLKKKRNAGMDYLERNLDKRENPKLLVEDCCSIIVVGMSYHPKEWLFDSKSFEISAYSYGYDYHIIIKEKLANLLSRLQAMDSGIRGRGFTDSAPVFERRLAQKAGLGWIGKNGCIINPKYGSFFFLGELFINQTFEPDPAFLQNYCAGCNMCVEACPTGTFTSNYNFDANRCISYQTIENKHDIPEDIQMKMQTRVFGCDRCQRVCPWNNQPDMPREHFFDLSAFTRHLQTLENPQQLTLEMFQKLKKNTAVARIKHEKWKGNWREGK